MTDQVISRHKDSAFAQQVLQSDRIMRTHAAPLLQSSFSIPPHLPAPPAETSMPVSIVRPQPFAKPARPKQQSSRVLKRQIF
jgi:hypothetical protein